jgi:hypothetical protein
MTKIVCVTKRSYCTVLPPSTRIFILSYLVHHTMLHGNSVKLLTGMLGFSPHFLFINPFSKETAIRSSPPLWPSGEMQFCLRDLNSLRTVTSPSTQARHTPYTVHSDQVLKWGGEREDLRVGPRRGRLYHPICLSRRERPPHGTSHSHFRVQGRFCPPHHRRHPVLPLRPHGQKRQEPGTHHRQARR